MKQTLALASLVLACCLVSQASMDAETILRHVQAHMKQSGERYTEDLRQLVAFPSVSALPEHLSDILAAASWLEKRLKEAGMQNVRILPTKGPRPVVYGEWLSAGPERPTALIYGHYDVQPIDPVEDWTSEPFEVVQKGGYFYGRGVDDDKGGLLQPLHAVESLLAVTGRLPLNVKFLYEGEEEVMSPYLKDFLDEHGPAGSKLLSADLALSADGGQPAEDQGGISLGLRGVVSMQLDVTSAGTDMHSGMKGGSVPNAARVVAALVAKLHDDKTHKVLVPGFYEGVSEPSAQDLADIDAYGYEAQPEGEALGLKTVNAWIGEEGYSTLARRWHRPTLEVVGIHGGFSGEGIKTVIPRHAFAKLSARLVPGQSPDSIYDKVSSYLAAICPSYINCTLSRLGGGAFAWDNPRDTPGNRAATAVLSKMMPKPPKFYRDGATIPALAAFQQQLGLHTTKFGWGLGEMIHAPNERLLVKMYEKGRGAWAQLLWELGANWQELQGAGGSSLDAHAGTSGRGKEEL